MKVLHWTEKSQNNSSRATEIKSGFQQSRPERVMIVKLHLCWNTLGTFTKGLKYMNKYHTVLTFEWVRSCQSSSVLPVMLPTLHADLSHQLDSFLHAFLICLLNLLSHFHLENLWALWIPCNSKQTDSRVCNLLYNIMCRLCREIDRVIRSYYLMKQSKQFVTKTTY